MSKNFEERDGLGLSEVLEALRSDLERSLDLAKGSAVQFPVQGLTVELKVGLTMTAEGKAGFRVPLLGAELGGSGARASETLQTVTLNLGQPLGLDGLPIRVAKATDEDKQ